MFSIPRPIVHIHRLCVNHLVYPLVLSSLFACALYLGRVYHTRTWTFLFLVWNLFLAWIPYVVSLGIVFLHRRYPRRWWLIAIPGFVWLVFLPNAPYILTDLWHLQGYRSVPMWYDIGMLVTFAWSGLFLAVISLYEMQSIVRDYFGSILGWLFALTVIGLSGFGIYLGRFLDWNSWDLILHPQTILNDILMRVVHPIQYSQTYAVSFLFAMFFFVCYLTFVSVGHRQKETVQN
jgi:uncharacterized membrane protein